MQQFEGTLNRMPVRTWRRLHVNDAGLALHGPNSVSFTNGADGADIRASGQVVIK
jgi:hypothetical protein